MLYCRSCGRELTEDMKYCPSCGTPTEKRTIEEVSVAAEDLVKKVKELIHEGNVTKIIVKDEKGKVLLEMPVTVGLIGTVLAPWLAALGVIAALVTRCNITVERREA
ncbi:hypothetical protein DRO55_04650 [Candidatus Bathyarchaeota archaeon]|nr:MAG: hypothetical protein DRO55_04650 [Candidatus Bathyarchaeota archaeon]